MVQSASLLNEHAARRSDRQQLYAALTDHGLGARHRHRANLRRGGTD